MRLALVVDGVDGPHAVAGLTGRFRLVPLTARELVEDDTQSGTFTGHVEEFPDRVTQSLSGLTNHSIEVVRVESERTIAAHLSSVPLPPGALVVHRRLVRRLWRRSLVGDLDRHRH